MEQKISAELRKKAACFTGHRHILPEKLEGIKGRLEQAIIDLYGKGIIYYGAGGAVGFDYEKRKVMRSEISEAAAKSSR